MKSNYLFPPRFKKIGWLLFIPGTLLGILLLALQFDLEVLDVNVPAIAKQPIFGKVEFFTTTENNILDEIIALLLILGSLLIAFSKEKKEDEFISKIRLESLVWATYVNYIIILLTILFIYDMVFFWVLVFNLFTLLFFFILRFQWALYKFKNQNTDEE